MAAPAAQVVLDSAGTVVLLNARAERDLGLQQRDVGRLFSELALSHRPLELRGSVAAVQASGQAAEIRDVAWTPPGAAAGRWDIRIAPLTVDGEAQGVHLVFEDVSERYELQLRLGHLDGELTTAYEELQSSSEELETTNEELQSAVEELETTNEELQSTNEELETMNEELQSTNEELQTLNDELRDRTLEVDRVNGFLQSILAGLELGRRRRRHRLPRAAVERRRRAAHRAARVRGRGPTAARARHRAARRRRCAPRCARWSSPARSPDPVDVEPDRPLRPAAAPPAHRHAAAARRGARCTGPWSRSPTRPTRPTRVDSHD